MARDNRAFARANRNMNAIVNGINDNMDALYRNTYMSTPQQSKDLQNLYDKINASIDGDCGEKVHRRIMENMR